MNTQALYPGGGWGYSLPPSCVRGIPPPSIQYPSNLGPRERPTFLQGPGNTPSFHPQSRDFQFLHKGFREYPHPPLRVQGIPFPLSRVPAVFLPLSSILQSNPTLLQDSGNHSTSIQGPGKTPPSFHVPGDTASFHQGSGNSFAIPSSRVEENPSLSPGSREYHLSPFRTQGRLPPPILGPKNAPPSYRVQEIAPPSIQCPSE